jgi:hypothetical protein
LRQTNKKKSSKIIGSDNWNNANMWESNQRYKIEINLN